MSYNFKEKNIGKNEKIHNRNVTEIPNKKNDLSIKKMKDKDKHMLDHLTDLHRFRI